MSVVEIDEAKAKDRAAWEAAHPDLAFWETIRTALQTQGGDTFFGTLQGVGLPLVQNDSYKGPPMFKGTVISQPSPKTILLNLDDPKGDAILKFDDNIKGEIPAGTQLQFKGVVDAWTKEPYTLTLEIQEPKTDLIGLPDGITFVPDATPKARRATPKTAPTKKAP
jgi:hypothetical protein